MHYHHRNYHHTMTLIKIIIITLITKIVTIIIVIPIQISVETRGKSCSMDLPQLSSAHCQWPDATFCLIIIIIVAIIIILIIIAVVVIINLHNDDGEDYQLCFRALEAAPELFLALCEPQEPLGLAFYCLSFSNFT